MTSFSYVSQHQPLYKDKNSGFYKHSHFLKATEKASRMSNIGLQYTFVSSYLKEEGEDFANTAHFEGLDTKQLYKECQKEHRVESCDTQSKYRTVDGSCNNMRDPTYGRANTVFQRIWLPEYDDGTSKPRTKGSSGDILPSARTVSREVGGVKESLSDYITALGVTFGQFIDHDIAFTPLMGNIMTFE